MNSIFVVFYHYGSYEDYTEVRLRAFSSMEEAAAFRDKHRADYERVEALTNKVCSEFNGWRTANPHPVMESVKLKMPQWQGKKGSKKNAPPEVLCEFKAREDEARAEYERVGRSNQNKMAEWLKAAVDETKRLMAKAGFTPEEVAAQQSMLSTRYDRNEYDIEEIPFGAEKA